jgi:hypothetical protein
MVLILKTLADLWRERLACLEARIAAGAGEAWYATLERRVLTYFLKRHADAPYADPPNRAEALDDESAAASDRLRLSPEVSRRLGLPTEQPKRRVHDDLAGLERAEWERRWREYAALNPRTIEPGEEPPPMPGDEHAAERVRLLFEQEKRLLELGEEEERRLALLEEARARRADFDEAIRADPLVQWTDRHPLLAIFLLYLVLAALVIVAWVAGLL